MTDNEIIKALECKAIGIMNCMSCPYFARYPECDRYAVRDALRLINRQQAEIERLQNDLAQTEDAYKTVHEMNGAYARKIDFAKAEAIKEFAERLKANIRTFPKLDFGGCFYYTIGTGAIDNLVKEMVGDGDAD